MSLGVICAMLEFTPIFGGNFDNSSNAGILSFNGNNDWSNSNNNVSARSIFVIKRHDVYTLQQCKHSRNNYLLKVINQNQDCLQLVIFMNIVSDSVKRVS